MEPADMIWKQITIPTKMAVGARQASKMNNGNTLSFKVTITSNQCHYINVHYNPNDTYKIELIHFRGSKRTVQREGNDIYVDNLNQVIYDYCHNK